MITTTTQLSDEERRLLRRYADGLIAIAPQPTPGLVASLRSLTAAAGLAPRVEPAIP